MAASPVPPVIKPIAATPEGSRIGRFFSNGFSGAWNLVKRPFAAIYKDGKFTKLAKGGMIVGAVIAAVGAISAFVGYARDKQRYHEEDAPLPDSLSAQDISGPADGRGENYWRSKFRPELAQAAMQNPNMGEPVQDLNTPRGM